MNELSNREILCHINKLTDLRSITRTLRHRSVHSHHDIFPYFLRNLSLKLAYGRKPCEPSTATVLNLWTTYEGASLK